MTTQLKLYNEALLICGERQLSTLTDTVEPRYLLDSVWSNGAVDFCLSQGQWRFATRAQSVDSNPSIVTRFGYRKVFTKPSDWVLTTAVCSDEYFRNPLLDYVFEAEYFYADIDPLYIRFVSNDAAYGTNYSEWPATFADYVAHHLASKIILKITSDEKKMEVINSVLKKSMHIAKNNDSMGDPTKFLPAGSWSRARLGGRGRCDGGSRNNLIG